MLKIKSSGHVQFEFVYCELSDVEWSCVCSIWESIVIIMRVCRYQEGCERGEVCV